MPYTSKSIIALLSCMLLACAIAAVPLVHRHSPTEQVPLHDYDASCSFVKADKGCASVPSFHLLACAALMFLFIAVQPIVCRRTDDTVPAHCIFIRKVQAPRAPPAG